MRSAWKLRLFVSVVFLIANPARAVVSANPTVVGEGSVVVPSATVPATPAAAPATPSINPAASTGQGSQNSGSGANAAAGAGLLAAGASMMTNPQTMPMGMALIAMGMLAMQQAGQDSGAANQSGLTAMSSATTPTTTATTTTPTPATDGGANAAFQTPAAQSALAAVTAAGGSMTPASVTMPDGTSVPWSAFGSEASLNAAGFDGAGAMKVVSQIEKKLGIPAKVSGIAQSEGQTPPGGGGYNAGSEFKLPNFKNPFAMTSAAKAQLAAGKTLTTSGGDPIGVKMDNLFGMIHRAYDRKRTLSTFIDDPNGRTDDEMTKPLVASPKTKFGRAPASTSNDLVGP